MHDWGGAIPQSISLSNVASCYTEAEFAKWTTGSTWSRSKNIPRPPKRIGKLRKNPQRPRTSFYSPTTGHESQRNSQKRLIRQFENHPKKEFFLLGLNKTEEINTFSERSKKLITDMGSTEIFEYRFLFMWNKSKRTKEFDKKNYDAQSIPGYEFFNFCELFILCSYSFKKKIRLI